jgi:hypothetical protein
MVGILAPSPSGTNAINHIALYGATLAYSRHRELNVKLWQTWPANTNISPSGSPGPDGLEKVQGAQGGKKSDKVESECDGFDEFTPTLQPENGSQP